MRKPGVVWKEDSKGVCVKFATAQESSRERRRHGHQLARVRRAQTQPWSKLVLDKKCVALHACGCSSKARQVLPELALQGGVLSCLGFGGLGEPQD